MASILLETIVKDWLNNELSEWEFHLYRPKGDKFTYIEFFSNCVASIGDNQVYVYTFSLNEPNPISASDPEFFAKLKEMLVDTAIKYAGIMDEIGRDRYELK